MDCSSTLGLTISSGLINCGTFNQSSASPIASEAFSTESFGSQSCYNVIINDLGCNYVGNWARNFGDPIPVGLFVYEGGNYRPVGAKTWCYGIN